MPLTRVGVTCVPLMVELMEPFGQLDDLRGLLKLSRVAHLGAELVVGELLQVGLLEFLAGASG